MSLRIIFANPFPKNENPKTRFPNFAQDLSWELVVCDDAFAAELDMPSRSHLRCAVSTTTARPIEADLVDLPNAVNAVPLSDHLGPTLNSAFNNPTEDPSKNSDQTFSSDDFKNTRGRQ